MGSEMCIRDRNNSESLIKQTNDAKYAYGYICLLLEKHMAMRVDWYPVDDCRRAMLNLMRVRTIS